MNCTNYVTGGPLTDEYAEFYIERDADFQAIYNLKNVLHYLLIVEPRQQGKTSLIHALMRNCDMSEICFIYIDVSTLDPSSEGSWYNTLTKRIIYQLEKKIEIETQYLVYNFTSWRKFLTIISKSAVSVNVRIVIALDEIGSINFSGATKFFSVLREIYNSRQTEIYFKDLSFILSGSFHPRNLIQDDKISPFNVAQRIRLHDFTLEQVSQLCKKGKLSSDKSGEIEQKIYSWTNGHPYLTQLFCSYLKKNIKSYDIDYIVSKIRCEDDNHLAPLFNKLYSNNKLWKYACKVKANEGISYFPNENPIQAKLELLGIIKDDNYGNCQIRNRIYNDILKCKNHEIEYKKNLLGRLKLIKKIQYRSEPAWWQIAFLSGFVVAAGTFLIAIIPSDWLLLKASLLIGMAVTVHLLFNNPKRRYFHSFLAAFTLFSTAHIIPALGLEAYGFGIFIKHFSSGPSLTFNVIVGLIMIFLLLLDKYE